MRSRGLSRSQPTIKQTVPLGLFSVSARSRRPDLQHNIADEPQTPAICGTPAVARSSLGCLPGHCRRAPADRVEHLVQSGLGGTQPVEPHTCLYRPAGERVGGAGQIGGL